MGTIYKLIIEDDEGKTTVYPLSQGEISIGRKEGNTIRLMERNVSRRHARLLRSNGSVFIEDLDSYNGIRINGERINGRYEVKEGDLVEIGDYHLALQAAEIEEEAQAAAARADTEANREWPTAGTVPDFRLPEEILAGVRAVGAPQVGPAPNPRDPRANAATRDTLVDTPAPPSPPAPAVVPSGKAAPSFANGLHDGPGATVRERDDHSPRALPPFPMSSGPSAPAPSVPLFPQRPGEQPPALKPLGKKDEVLPATAPINVGPARVAAVPRLVCVSTNYAGKEFALTRPELIIGRVEDNDIVIEHRSVSRNHAKIVYDGRAHKIIDLQSANGILVNGEEYAMTDLRRNDLIELGHVRFRFIPAGDPFIPTDDELREMRDAGVTMPANEGHVARSSLEPTQPHSAGPVTAPPLPKPAAKAHDGHKHDAPEVPAHFDPSTAATVTDTPLSALAMNNALTPQVEASATLPGPPPRKPEPVHEKVHDKAEKERASARSDTAAPRSAHAGPGGQHHDQRPTEINISARGAPAANGSAAAGASPPPRSHAEPPPLTRPGANLVEIEGRLDPPKAPSRTVLFVALGVLIVAIAAIVFAVTSGPPEGAADRALMELMKAKNYKAAVEFCTANRDAFKDPASVKLCLDALAEQTKEGEASGDPNQPSGALDPTIEKIDPEAAQPVPGEDEGEDEARGEDDPAGVNGEPRRRNGVRKATAKAAAQDKTKAGALPGDKATRAKDLHDRAWRAWTNGDATKAVELLQECVKVANLGKCHRTLGSVYAQIGDTQKSLEHYRRYLQVEPNASDVARVKDIIRDAESAL